jgi:hypothetical protein
MIEFLPKLAREMRALKAGDKPPADLDALKAAVLEEHPTVPPLMKKHQNFKVLFDKLAEAVWSDRKFAEVHADYAGRMNKDILAQFEESVAPAAGDAKAKPAAKKRSRKVRG